MAAATTLPESASSGRPVLSAVRTAREALSDCSPTRLWALSEPEVTEAMTVLGELASSISALTVAVMCEAKERSLGVGDGWGPVDWARACAPLMPLRDLTEAEVVADAGGELRLASVVAGVLDGAQPGLAGDGAEGCGVLPVGKAAQIVRFHKSVRGMADADALEATTQTLLEAGRGTDGLSERDLAAAIRHAGLVLRPDRLNDDEAEVKRAHRSLIKSKGPMGMSRYAWLLDEESAAIVDAAVDALAKPKPDEDTGEHDGRAPETRRADALLDLVIRAVGAPDGVARQAKTQLMVSVGLEVLEGRCRGTGLTAFGEVLPAVVVRRLACDAQVVPVVLGTRGEVLDQGEAIRLFNRAQVRHLWLRDKHCTFPGCHKPAAWTDAHHLLHWAHGGPTDIWNAALLCRAHHSVVHTHRYAGRVVEGPRGPVVEWDLTRGSYDAMLAAHRAHRESLRNRAPDDGKADAAGDGSGRGRADGTKHDGVGTGTGTGTGAGAGAGAGAGRRLEVGAYRSWVAEAWPFAVPERECGWRRTGAIGFGAGFVGSPHITYGASSSGTASSSSPSSSTDSSGPPRP
jgi:hypothetical protein